MEVSGISLGGATVNVFPVPYLDDVDHKLIVLHCIDDAVNALANSISVASGKFLSTGRPGVFRETMNTMNDLSADVFLWDDLDFLHRRGLDENPIFSHVVSDPSRHPQRVHLIPVRVF